VVTSFGKTRLQSEITKLESEIETKQNEMEQNIMPKYEQEKTALLKVEKELADTKRQIEQLYSKQGRSSQFKSMKERDTFLKGEIKTLKVRLVWDFLKALS
jgi:structural maintenance of chromosome 3 (chondroitin sulfate proteoglycan 6)